MKIVAIASKGGHWVELLRLRKSFEQHEVVYLSTIDDLRNTVAGYKFYSVEDSSRWNKLRVLTSFISIWRIIFTEKPDVIISTGAAPGLLGMLAGRISGAKTIWIDSIANVDGLSLSGRLANYFVDKVYTQWPELSNSKIDYAGNILL